MSEASRKRLRWSSSVLFNAEPLPAKYRSIKSNFVFTFKGGIFSSLTHKLKDQVQILVVFRFEDVQQPAAHPPFSTMNGRLSRRVQRVADSSINESSLMCQSFIGLSYAVVATVFRAPAALVSEGQVELVQIARLDLSMQRSHT